MRTTKLIALVIVVALAVVGGVVLGSRHRAASPALRQAASSVGSASSPSSLVSVDVVAGSPADFVGAVKVSGTVTSIDRPKHSLVLGCSDACVAVPVTYSGPLPKPKSNVVVTGVIAKSSGGTYQFTASDVEVR